MKTLIPAITSVRFRNFKAFRDYSLSLRQMNVLVGPNNAGKSTILGAFRTLAIGLRRARARSPVIVDAGSYGQRVGYVINSDEVPISLENVHTDYSGIESSVAFRLNTGDQFVLCFPNSGGACLFVNSQEPSPREPSKFKSRFPVTVGCIPVLGPVEHQEPYLGKEYVQSGLWTHRASRHFRNYWLHFPQEFSQFSSFITRSWPEMNVLPPELVDGPNGPIVVMFCEENRIARELFWIGSGFQVWCQLLTHIISHGPILS